MKITQLSLAALTCLAAVAASDLNMVFVFSPSFLQPDQKGFTNEQKQPLDEGIKELSGRMNSSIAISYGDFFDINGGVGVQFVVTNLEKTIIQQVALGISLAPEEFLEGVNNAVSTFYLGKSEADFPESSRIPPVVQAFIPKNETKQANGAAENEEKFTSSFVLEGADLAQQWADPAKRFTLIQNLIKAIAASSGIDSNMIEVNIKAGGATLRRLLQTSTEVEWSALGVAPAQAEALVAGMSEEGAFSETLVQELQKADNTTFAAVTAGGFTAESSVVLYAPPEYVITDNAANMHALTRLVGTNDFQTLISERDGVNMDYLIGIAINSAVFFLMAVFTLTCFPCCYCCCCRSAKKSEKKININTIVIGLALIVGVTAMGVGIQADKTLEGAVVDFEQAATNINGVVTDTMDVVDSLKAGLDDGKDALATDPVCGMVDNMRKNFDQPAINDIDLSAGADAKTMLADVSKLLKQFQPMISSGTKAMFAFLFLITGMYCFFAVQVKFNIMKSCDGVRKCFDYSCTPIAAIVMFISWLLAGIFLILAILFGDMCAQDPVSTVFEMDLMGSSAGDGMELIKYLMTCTGNPPAMLNMVFDVERAMSATSDNMDGLKLLIEKSGDASCQGLDLNPMEASLNSVSASITDVNELLRCKTFNSILVQILHSGICTNLQSSTVSLWVALCLSAIAMLAAIFNFTKLSKEKGKTIAPLQSIDTDDKELLKIGGEEADAPANASAESPAETDKLAAN